MKSSILATIVLAFPSLIAATSTHDRSLLTFRRHQDSHKRHASNHHGALAAKRSASRMTIIKKKRTLQARKTPGNGDSTTEPDTIAQGTYTAKQGCAVWHVVGEGEVCLGLIDKSSADFTIEKFHTFNPSVNKACTNLVQGASYCVDTVAGSSGKTATKVEKTGTGISTPKVQLAAPKASSESTPQTDADEEEDCEEEEDTSAADEDDEDCEEEEDDTEDSVVTVKVKASNNAAPAKVAPKVDEQKVETPKVEAKKVEAPKETYVAPSSTYVAPSPTYVAPSSTYVAPSSTYVAPSPSPKAEEAKKVEEPKEENNGGNNGGNWAYTNMQATYYYQNGNPGSCGKYNSDSAMIVAVKSDIMGSQLCGKTVKLRNASTGKEVTATVADTCPTCAGLGIDLSEAVFLALSPAGLGPGVLSVDYSIL